MTGYLAVGLVGLVAGVLIGLALSTLLLTDGGHAVIEGKVEASA